MPVFNNALAGAAGSGGADADYTIERSLRFNSGDSSYLNRTPSSAGNRTTWTWSGWVKRGSIATSVFSLFAAYDSSNTRDVLRFESNQLNLQIGTSGTYRTETTDAVFRDPSAWYHIVVAFDSTQSTAADRLKFYVNGVEQSVTGTPVDRNTQSTINNADAHYIGARSSSGSAESFFDGYMAEVYLVDGQALAPTAFGEFDADTGAWNPIQLNVTSPNDGTVWSSYLSTAAGFDSNYPATNAFDSSTSTKTQTPQNTGGYTTGSTNAFEFIPPSPIAFTSSVKIRGRGTGQTTMSFQVDTGSGYGSTTTTTSDVLETVVTGSGNLVKLKVWTPTWSGENELAAVEIDGVMLVDGVGKYGKNGFYLDFDPTAGNTYSGGVSSTSTANSSYPASYGFDGNVGSSGTANWYTQGSNETITVDLSSYNVTASSSVGFNVRLGGPGSSATVSVTATIGGTAYTQTFQNSSTQDQLLTFNGSGAVTTIVATLTQANSSYGWGFTGVQVDGTYLVNTSAPGVDASGTDNHWTGNNLFIAPEGGTFELHTATLNPSGGASYETGRGELYMAFDGSADSYLLLSNQNNHGINFSPGINVSAKVEIWGLTSNQYASTNLVGSAIAYTPGQWTTLFVGSGTLTNITMISNNNRPALARIRIDGVELIATNLDTDSLVDSPTNYEATSGNNGGNYATWNDIHPETTEKSISLSDGALKATYTQSFTYTSGERGLAFSTIGMSSGKWYFELTGGALYNDDHAVGIATKDANGYFDPEDNLWSYRGNGYKYVPAPNSGGYGDAWGENDVIGVAFDADAGSLTMYKNGTSQGVLVSGLDTAETYFFVWGGDGGGTNGYTWNVTANFGARPFAYTPPTGHKSLCTKNLTTPLIEDPSDHFDTKLWTGNGGEQIVGGGIRYSNYVTGDIDSSFPAYRAFRNVTDQVGVRTTTANGATIVFEPPSPIEFSTSFKIWAASDGGQAGTSFTVTHAGGDTDFTSSVATGTTQTAVDLAQISGVTSPITRITVVSGGWNPRFSGIEVDGSMLIDSTADAYNFSPDFAWIKSDSNGEGHSLNDTVRGENKSLASEGTAAENTQANKLTAFNSDGFKLGNSGRVNYENYTYVGWGWDGGDLATTSDTTNYNQSQVFSAVTKAGSTTYSPTDSDTGFLGAYPTTNAFNSSGLSQVAYSDNNNVWIYVQLSTAITVSSTIKFGARNTVEVKINGTDYSYTGGDTTGNQTTRTISFSGSLTEFAIRDDDNSGYSTGLSYLEVDGKQLLDTGVIPAGSLNSSLYDDSQTWTDDFSGPSGSISYVSAMFDGNLGTEVYASTHPATITWTPTNGLAYTSMRINARTQANHSNGVKYKLVGGSEVSIGTSTTATWYTLPANSTLEYVKIERPSGSNAAGLVAAVEKDGKILVDAGTSLANVPALTSTVRANPTAGFSIVSYTGSETSNDSVAHGLNAPPKLIITKNRDNSTYSWRVFTTAVDGSLDRLFLDTSTTSADQSGVNVPTSSVFYLGSNLDHNKSGDDIIAYCFSPVENYSAFGTYEALSAGPIVYTPFRPKLLICKSIDQGQPWQMYDAARGPYNVIDQGLQASESIAEYSGTVRVDFLSNGFKIRAPINSEPNVSGMTYLYMCWAENPFQTARAR